MPAQSSCWAAQPLRQVQWAAAVVEVTAAAEPIPEVTAAAAAAAMAPVATGARSGSRMANLPPPARPLASLESVPAERSNGQGANAGRGYLGEVAAADIGTAPISGYDVRLGQA